MGKIISVIFAGLFAVSAIAAETAKVFFEEPKADSTVKESFHVKMGLEGMKLCPANQETADKKCGHHHLIVDGGPVPEGAAIPNDPTHIHFGKGQSETDLKLAPGKHKLTLQFADFAHRSYGEKMSATISVEVK